MGTTRGGLEFEDTHFWGADGKVYRKDWIVNEVLNNTDFNPNDYIKTLTVLGINRLIDLQIEANGIILLGIKSSELITLGNCKGCPPFLSFPDGGLYNLVGKDALIQFLKGFSGVGIMGYFDSSSKIVLKADMMDNINSVQLLDPDSSDFYRNTIVI